MSLPRWHGRTRPQRLRPWLRVGARDAVFWTSLGLGVLLLGEVARVGRLLSTPAPPVAAAMAARGDARPVGIDVARITAAHLFGEPPAPTRDPTTAPDSRGDLVLTGVMATEDPQHGLAIIGAPGRPQVVGVGEGVIGATLRFVYADRVVLERDGSLESVKLPLPRDPATGLPAPRRRSEPDGIVAAVAADDSGGRSTQAERLADVSDATDARGRFLGVRVSPGPNVAQFIGSGLVSGDVIVAIDGSPIGVPGTGEEAWKQAHDGSTLTVLRRGKPQQLTLNLAP